MTTALRRSRLFPIASALLAVVALAGTTMAARPTLAKSESDNVVVRWNHAVLQAVRVSKLGPPMVARAIAIVQTCVYDSWAAYDVNAVGTQFGAYLRQPEGLRTPANKEKAISFGAYRAAADLFPESRAIFDRLMSSLGYNPSDTSADVNEPSGVGNTACAAVLEFRHHDGSNQLGDLNPGAYSDYTGYKSVNAPMVVAEPLDPATVRDPNRWQQLVYNDKSGKRVTQPNVGAQWDHVTPFAMDNAAEMRSGAGAAKYGSEEYARQAAEILDMSAHLTDRQKVIAEYWADGPNSELPPGHWELFGQFVSRRDRHTVDDDAKMFFALANAIFDAGIVAWDNKVYYDSVRPITAIRYLYRGKKVKAWGGPGKGTRTIKGESWLPFQPTYFPTPPFAEYSSGHSNFSAAGAEILRRFTGSDKLGMSVTVAKGSSGVEPRITPRKPVTLSWATFSQAADEAGLSRRLGGIHFEQGDLDARASGRAAAGEAWAVAQSYITGRADVRGLVAPTIQGVGLYTDPSVANQVSAFTINRRMISCGVGTLANGSWSGPFSMLMYSLHIDTYSVIPEAGMIKATGTMRSITAVGGQTLEDATHDFVAVAKDSPVGGDQFAIHFSTGFWNPRNPMCTKSDLVAGTCRFGGRVLSGDVKVA